MPLYEYQCPKGHVTEQIRTLAEFTESIDCPRCSKARIPAKTTAVLKMSKTGTPILKAGRCGGFYKPNA